MAQRGRPRKLTEVNTEDNTSVKVSESNGATTPVEKEALDPFDIKSYTPYEHGNLPKSTFTVNNRGIVSNLKRGAARYYFSENRRELIRIYHARSKKTELAWMCKPNHSNPKIKADHIRFRQALLKAGVPIRGVHF